MCIRDSLRAAGRPRARHPRTPGLLRAVHRPRARLRRAPGHLRAAGRPEPDARASQDFFASPPAARSTSA
eukprot:8036555-Alexandrium_andersonii.AAC.1